MVNYEKFVKAGKNLTTLNGKVPITSNWINNVATPQILQSHTGNFGWVLSLCDLVIDVDFRNDGQKSLDKLISDLSLRGNIIDLIPTVKTPNGIHYYLSISKDVKIRKKSSEYPGIDFLSYGSMVVIPGSVNKGIEYKWIDPDIGFMQSTAPTILVNMLINNDKNSVKNDPLYLPICVYNEEEIESMLYGLNPDCDYKTWLNIGMALHSSRISNGFELWDNWSKNSSKYVDKECEYKWGRFTGNKNITIGTLKFLSDEAIIVKYKNAVEEFISDIDKTTKETIDKVIDKIVNFNFNDIDKELIAVNIQKKYKDLLGIKVPIADIRKRISVKTGGIIQVPDWCNEWVYVNSHKAFFNLDTMKPHSAESFNIGMGKNIPENENGYKPMAVKYIADYGLIRKVDIVSYLPSYKDNIVIVDNLTVLNTFDYKSLPKYDVEYTEEGLKSIEVIKQHIDLICNSDEYSKTLTQWLAHNIQFPGKKIRWAPLIQSIEGIGKSFFGELLRACLGDINVGTVSSNLIASGNIGWATGYAVNVLEELRIVGHSRYDAINSLKPLISDRRIQISDKYITAYQTTNTCNYIGFTNHRDSLPISRDDRRFFIIFVEIDSEEDIEMHTGIIASEYFDRLFNAIDTHKSEITRWFHEYEISKEFMTLTRAPLTKFKAAMVDTENATFEGYNEVKEIISGDINPMCNEQFVDYNVLYDIIAMNYPSITMTTYQKSNILKKLGYIFFGRVRYNENRNRIWTKKVLEGEKLKSLVLEAYAKSL